MPPVPEEQIRRAQLAESFRQEFDATLDARIDRHIAAAHHPIVANSLFAPASAECLESFRDGRFYGCISLCQAAGEALVRYMCTSNGWTPAKDFDENVRQLQKRGKVDEKFVLSCNVLWKARNTYHHLNSSVETDRIRLEALALEKIRSLATMEAWAFEYTTPDGNFAPARPQYWRVEGQMAQVYLRLE